MQDLPGTTTQLSHIRPGRRGGFALVYVMLLMVVIMGFVSLGVDFAHIQLVKTELLNAADASARAAAAQLSNGVSATQNAAVLWGGYNTANSTSVVIDPNNDIDFGTWSTGARTFTVLTGANRSTANAVRVWARRTNANSNATQVMFGSVFGITSCDTTESAIAYMSPSNVNPGFVGLNTCSINQGGSGEMYSYDSSVNTPSSSVDTSNATVASNSNIYLNYAYIDGSTKAGVGMGYTYGGQASQVTKGQSNLTAALSYSAVTVGSFNNAGLNGSYYNSGTTNFSMSSGNTYTMPAGTYSFNNFTMTGGTLTAGGAVTIYVSGTFSMSGSSKFYALSRQPGNTKLQMVGSSSGTFTGYGSYLEADVYGPSATFTLTSSGSNTTTFAGRVIAGSFTQSSNNIAFHDTHITGVGWGTNGTGLIYSVQ